MSDCLDPPLITFAAMNNEPIEKVVPTSLKQSPVGRGGLDLALGAALHKALFPAGCMEGTYISLRNSTASTVLSEHGDSHSAFVFSSDGR